MPRHSPPPPPRNDTKRQRCATRLLNARKRISVQRSVFAAFFHAVCPDVLAIANDLHAAPRPEVLGLRFLRLRLFVHMDKSYPHPGRGVVQVLPHFVLVPVVVRAVTHEEEEVSVLDLIRWA